MEQRLLTDHGHRKPGHMSSLWEEFLMIKAVIISQELSVLVNDSVTIDEPNVLSCSTLP